MKKYKIKNNGKRGRPMTTKGWEKRLVELFLEHKEKKEAAWQAELAIEDHLDRRVLVK